MVIDCFTFYNELKMLNFRLHELKDHVDYFILVEATHTHAGNPKPLYFQEKKHLFKPFLEKIIHIIVDDFPETDDTWVREKFQRAAISRGLDQFFLQPNDIIMISDVDEIPNTDSIEYLQSIDFEGIYSLEQDLYYYNLNTKQNSSWTHAKICTYSKYLQIGDPEKVRFYISDLLNNGGWHFSYFGDVNFIINKLQNFAHSELNDEQFTNPEVIIEKINNNKDLFGREGATGFSYVKIEDNSYLPKKYKMLL